MSEKRTFFISRAGADRRWAEVIASVVKDAGHEAIHQDQDFPEGTSFSHNMMLAAESDCTIAVLSPAYFESEHCLAELHAALASDPLGARGQILPVLVAPCELPRLIGHLAYVDLVGKDDATVRQRITNRLVKHGKIDASKLTLPVRTRRAAALADRNRSAMLEKVRNIWITGFLQKSLFHETRILLGLSERPDAVARPMDLLVQRPDQGDRPLPPETRVIDVYDDVNRSLLILGAPGSGKTTLLLELARDLLDRATQDPAHPIPVVFPLSTWAESRKPLAEWLADELNLRYDVPRKLAAEWIETDEVLPLLDGLDEVKAEHRAACVEALNAYHQSHGFLPQVISSRTADYEALAAPLRLQGAIVVQPLSPAQLAAYLTEIGPAGAAIRDAIRDDREMRDLLETPLMLNIITVAYAGQAEAPVPTIGTLEERREALFGAYVDQMFRRRRADQRYPKAKTMHWLGWLARQMKDRGETVFYLERMQVDWLPQRMRKGARVSSVLAFVLAFGLGGGLAFGLWGGLDFGLVGGLAFGLGGGLIFGLVGVLFGYFSTSYEMEYAETIKWSLPHKSARPMVGQLIHGLFVGLAFVLVGGLVLGLAGGLAAR